jgi:osmoprotectant transport system permease protein
VSTGGDTIDDKGSATPNRVILLLVVVGIAGALGPGFVGFSQNRILSAKMVSLWAAVSPAFLGVVGVALALLLVGAVGRGGRLAALCGAILLFLADLMAAGLAATSLLQDAASPAARVSLGGGFWVLLIVAFLAMAEALQRLNVGLALRILLGLAILFDLALLASGHWFDDLSIVREWANRKEAYAAAFGDHIRLVLSALALAVAIGVPLGRAATRSAVRSGRIFTVLSLVQTIPSIALFGLLIGPLTALSEAVPGLREIGVRGIGFTPALIALTLYGLLPIARNTETGVKGVPAAAIDAARGMGMTALQITTRVSLPLALPTLLAGLRIVTVQLVGLTVVAALIGAGGFGSFVFLGLGQTATDLVLLGALSAIVLALVADAALRLLTLAATRAFAA